MGGVGDREGGSFTSLYLLILYQRIRCGPGMGFLPIRWSADDVRRRVAGRHVKHNSQQAITYYERAIQPGTLLSSKASSPNSRERGTQNGRNQQGEAGHCCKESSTRQYPYVYHQYIHEVKADTAIFYFCANIYYYYTTFVHYSIQYLKYWYGTSESLTAVHGNPPPKYCIGGQVEHKDAILYALLTSKMGGVDGDASTYIPGPRQTGRRTQLLNSPVTHFRTRHKGMYSLADTTINPEFFHVGNRLLF